MRPPPSFAAVAFVAAALLLGSPQAEAQVFWPDDCGRAVGWAAGATPANRDDWDFTTPGTIAPSSSPVLSQWCNQAVSDRITSWFGVDIIPLYQHSYRRIRDRAPLVAMLDIGGTVKLQRHHHLGLHATTNALTWGGGLRWEWVFRAGDSTHRNGLDVRANVLWGTEPNFQTLAMYTFRSKAVTR